MWKSPAEEAAEALANGPKINLLVAFPYCTPSILEAVASLGDECRFLIDSGGFTAWKSGNPITLDAYCNFLEKLPVKPWRYFALDVIGDQAATLANYHEMRRRGFTPIPIITRGGPSVLDTMDAYYETSDVVGFGGMAQGHVRPQPYVKAILQHAAGRRVHLLGFTNFVWLKHLRPYMADSSSWTEADRYGWLRVYAGHGNWIRVHRSDIAKGPPPAALITALEGFGFDPYVLQHAEHWRGDDGASRWMTCTSWIKASIDVERNLGTKMFIALAANRPDLIVSCFRIATGALAGEAARQTRINRSKAA